jgi:hypothetical protein
MQTSDNQGHKWDARHAKHNVVSAEHYLSIPGASFGPIKCRYGKVGDRLWVRESFGKINGSFVYRADFDPAFKLSDAPWGASIFMLREHSRITLEITNIRVERVQDISESDARAEGLQVNTNDSRVFADEPLTRYSAAAQFAEKWDTINGKRAPWSSNPWVWLIEFKKIKSRAIQIR